MLRRSLLYLSRSHRLRQWMEQSEAARRLTARFIAGSTLADELGVIAQLSAQGFLATADFLGENVTSLAEANQSRETYLQTQPEVWKHSATVSIKLTHFGLDFSRNACVENVAALVQCAESLDSRIEIDMESSEYTERTLDIVRELNASHRGRVRVAIQAYLHRTEADLRELSRLGVPVRLCKGAYREPPSVAVQSKAEVDQRYLDFTRYLLDHGTYPAIAGHDPRMIDAAVAHVREQKIASERFEFQMLYGIRRDLQRQLVEKGFRVRLYVPYGTAWFPYFMRRLAERPANLLFLLRNMVRQ